MEQSGIDTPKRMNNMFNRYNAINRGRQMSQFDPPVLKQFQDREIYSNRPRESHVNLNFSSLFQPGDLSQEQLMV